MSNIQNIKHNKLVKFLLKSSDAPFGTSGIVIIVATMLMTVAFILFAAEQTRLLQLEFIDIGFHNPKFFENTRGIAGYDENLSYTKPTSNYITYELVRQNIFPIGAIGIFIYILLNAWGEASGMFGRGSTKPLFLKFLAMIVLVFIFVPVWDVLAVEVERYGIGMLNPMYSYTKDQTDDNCVKNPSGVLLAVQKQNFDMHQRLGGTQTYLKELQGHPIPGPCDPELRIAYIYQKAFSGATSDLSEDALAKLDIFELALTNLSNLGRLIGDVIFLGMTKTMMLFSITLAGVIIMTIRELFLALIISLLPLFILLAFIPKLGEIFGTLLKSILPLLLIPVITAAVFLTGAGIILDMEDEFVEGYRPPGIDNFTFWIAAVSLLILATGIPILMAPILSSVTSQATQLVGTAVTTGVISAMGVMKGGAQGVGAAASSLKGGQGFKMAAKQFGGGLAMGAGGAMATDMGAGLGQIEGKGNAGSSIEKSMASKMTTDAFIPNPKAKQSMADSTETESGGAIPISGGSKHAQVGDSSKDSKQTDTGNSETRLDRSALGGNQVDNSAIKIGTANITNNITSYNPGVSAGSLPSTNLKDSPQG